MNSEFQQLADKVSQLASLAHGLRDENADLRRKLQALADESAAKLLAQSNDSAARLQALSDESAARLQAVTDDSAAKLQAVTDDSTAKLRELATESGNRIDALSEENAMLKQRVDEAYSRVAAVLEQLPAPAPQEPEETAEEAA